MTIQVTGTLTDPSGIVASTVPIRIIALQGLGNVGAGAITIPVTSTLGVYDFQLEPGRYSIEIRYGQVYELQGRVIVNDDSPSPVNLSGLLALTQPLAPAEIALVRELVAQAEQAVTDAEAQVVLAQQAVTDAEAQVALATSEANRAAAQVALAAAQVNLATAQADRAELEADRASQITGLDTVAEAVDLAITNEYLTARTQGDVDAERALKRERFAGSGWEHFGRHNISTNEMAINEGLNAFVIMPNILSMGRRLSDGEGTSKTAYPVMQMAGFTVYIEGLNDPNVTIRGGIVKFPVAPDGRDTYNSTNGTQVRHADAATAFAAETATNQVVTRRVDMWGFEGFLEEVTTGNPFVYPNGLIQSQATTMNGIPTVNGTRPVSYYAVFDGDTTSVGRGVNFFAATAAQQEAMLNDPKNNLYRLEDGRLVQFRVRQRTIAGPGNGDWGNINPNVSGSGGLQFSSSSLVIPQGMTNTPSGTQFVESVSEVAQNELAGLGAFVQMNNTTTAAVNGECYFLVGGTVSRLAQGAYHPEHNSFGSMQFRNDANNADVNWNGSGLTGITSQLLCFTRAASATGAIGQASGRTNDSRLHDAIYGGGLGGVVDYRWSANDRSGPKWGAQAKLEAEAGEYRGLELLQRTRVYSEDAASSSGASRFVQLPVGHGIKVGSLLSVVDNGTLVIDKVIVTSSVGTGAAWTDAQTYSRVSGTTYQAVNAFDLDVSVSGNFTRTDAIGDPVNLLATFPAGIEGGWIDQIPNDPLTTNQRFSLTKKALSFNRAQTSQDNGVTWVSRTISAGTGDAQWNSTPNTIGWGVRIALNIYIADAKKTRRSTNTALLNAQSGQYGVTATASSDIESGGLMFESMLGKVATSAATANGAIQTYPYMLLNLVPSTGNIDPLSGRESQHAPLMLAAPTNDSRGIKYAAHQVNDNGQATLNFIFNELDHNGTDWGDDSRLRVLNGTYTNQNGVTGLLADVDELAIPYGLIKNEV